jgi:hypothetical protein
MRQDYTGFWKWTSENLPSTRSGEWGPKYTIWVGPPFPTLAKLGTNIRASWAAEKVGLAPAKAPASAEALGVWIGAFWSGMELEMMLEVDESEGHYREALQAMQKLLVQLGDKASTPLLAAPFGRRRRIEEGSDDENRFARLGRRRPR